MAFVMALLPSGFGEDQYEVYLLGTAYPPPSPPRMGANPLQVPLEGVGGP